MQRFAIETLDDPRVGPYRDVRQKRLLRLSGLFIAEGSRVVRRLIKSDFQVESVLVSDKRATAYRDWLPIDAPVYVVPQKLAEQLVGYNFHTGILACGRRKLNPELSAVVSAGCAQGLLVACSRVNDPENLGAIVRLCAAFGVDGVLLDRGCCDPFSRRALRVSMGSALNFPIRECGELPADLARLREERRFRLAATVARGPAEPLHAVSRPDRVVLLFGNEADGLDEELVDACDLRITVSLAGTADSLNVAVAAGIILYHLNHPR